MKYHEMTKNYIFREFECGLSIEQAANLCFKSVRTIKEWDKGKEIPKECKRLMRLQSRLELSPLEEWNGFRINNHRLELPTGHSVTPQEILIGIALLEIKSDIELSTTTKILKYVRSISKMKGR
ncbi:regulator [Vibrio europaeus]|uniref:regulator n=1 Tax=Vibrio europaeus TaxID=300876 RepID=UPI00233EE178|nr:regulator [Vibrio europaeus]MDC5853825.1 regulator [Vibrio europaeus]